MPPPVRIVPLALVLTLPLLSACDRTPTGDAPARSLPVAFNATPPTDTSCAEGVGWGASDPHYLAFDVQVARISQCGAISFSGQTGHWDVTYDFSGAHAGSWSTLQRFSRRASNGAYDDSVAQHAHLDADSFQVPFKLANTFDLIGLQHQITTNDTIPPRNEQEEAWAQIWRTIGRPAITGITVDKDTVTIDFTNNSRQRDIDTTFLQRKDCGNCSWVQRGSVVGNASRFVDTVLSVQTPSYRLQHISAKIVDSRFPNAPSPNSGWVDTTIVARFPPPTFFYCDDTLQPAVLCFWRVGTDTAGIEVERNGAITDTLAAGSDSLVHTDVATHDTLTYRVRHLSVTHNTVSDWVHWGPFAVEPTPPGSLGCSSSEGVIGCGWVLGEVYDSSQVQRKRETARSFSNLTVVDPGITNYPDSTVQIGETWCYRVRHRRGSTATSWADLGCATAQSGPGPLPGRPDGT